MTAPFLVFGAGRCGTTSMYHILQSCKNVAVIREDSPYMVDWYNPEEKRLDQLVDWFNQHKIKGRVAGSVARYWLPHVETIRKKTGKLNLICLHRSKEGSIESWMKWKGVTTDRLRPGRSDNYSRFPIIDAHTIKQSYEFYWEMYEAWSRSIEGVFHVSMQSLNDKRKVNEILEHLGVAKKNRTIPKDRKMNKSKKTWKPTDV